MTFQNDFQEAFEDAMGRSKDLLRLEERIAFLERRKRDDAVFLDRIDRKADILLDLVRAIAKKIEAIEAFINKWFSRGAPLRRSGKTPSTTILSLVPPRNPN